MEEKKFKLPEEVITVKFIPRKRGMAANVGDDHVISGGMLDRASRKLSAPLQRNGSIANILSTDEKNYLEEITGLNLSVHGDFWKNFKVSLFKSDAANKFDLSNPMDYLQYAILRAYKNTIAKSWKDRNKRLEYQFAIVRSGEEEQEDIKAFNFKKEAFKMFGKIEDDRDKMFAVLKLLSNKPISKDSKLEWLQSKVGDYVDNKPKEFLSVVNDTSFEIKKLIHEAIDRGIILKQGNKYSTEDGLELAEEGKIPSFDNAVAYLEDPRNEDVKALIEAKLN